MDDPKFEKDLVNQIKHPPLKVRTGRRSGARPSSPTYLNLGLKRSLIAHGSILAVFFVGSVSYELVFGPTKEERERARAKMQRQAIRVDVVDLPSLKLSDLQNIDASKDVDPRGEDKDEKTAAPPPPSEKAMKIADKEAVKAGTKKLSKTEQSEQQRLQEIRDRLRADARRKELLSKLGGGGDGRPILAGNKLSAGNSIKGDIATEAEAYHGRLRSHLYRAWEVPGWMNASNLRAKILVKFASDGRVSEKEFLKRSGNSDFDATVERAIERASPFPPPPPELARIYRDEGVEWGFPE